jgi:hypothetical protein
MEGFTDDLSIAHQTDQAFGKVTVPGERPKG